MGSITVLSGGGLPVSNVGTEGSEEPGGPQAGAFAGDWKRSAGSGGGPVALGAGAGGKGPHLAQHGTEGPGRARVHS